MTEQYSNRIVKTESEYFTEENVKRKQEAPHASCYPENKWWIPEFGDTLIVIGRHPEQQQVQSPLPADDYDTDLTDRGIQQGEEAARMLFREIGYTPAPRKYGFSFSNRKRTEQASTIKYQKLLLDETAPYQIIERGVDTRICTADQLTPLVKMSPNRPEIIIPTYLNSLDSVLEQMGSEPKETTFKKILGYIQEKNEYSLNSKDSTKMHVYFVDTHETTLALLLSKFFPEQNPQADHSEFMAITTGNPDNAMSIVWRDLPPRVASITEVD